MENIKTFDISGEMSRLVPVLGKQKVAKLEAAYLLGDENYRKRIREVIDGLNATFISDSDLKESVLMEPPAKESIEGELPFGTILYGKKPLYPLFLKKQDLLTHIGIFGSSGSGKTNIVHYLVGSLADQNIPIIIFDFSKRNYRDLLSISELRDRIKVYTVGRDVSPFRFNPLMPPDGVQVSQWIKEFAEIFDHAYWLLGGGRHVILKLLDGLYKKYAPGQPKISDLRDWLDAYAHRELSSRENNWIATAKRPLVSLCLRETGEIFDCDVGILPSSFFTPGQITILELDALSNDDKTFFIEILLQWIRDWLLASNMREKLRGVIMLEEAHHVLNRDKTKKFGVETVTDLIFREVRELGVGMIYIDQHPSLVSYPALGNTSNQIYMNLGLDTKYSSDIQDASSMLGLPEDAVDYLRRLPVGHAFMLIRRSAFPNPFLVKFPLVPIEKGSVTDDKVREAMGVQLIEELKARTEARDSELKSDPKAFADNVFKKQYIEKRVQKVNSNGWKIIDVLAKAEASYTSEIYKRLKMSYRVFNKEVQKLIDLGLIATKEGKVYKQNAIYHFLTHDGELAFGLRSDKVACSAEMDVEKAKDKIVQGLTLKGWAPSEKGIDRIAFEDNGKRRVVKIEAAADREKIYKDVEESAIDGELYFVCGSERVRNAVMQQAAKFNYNHRGMNMVIFTATLDELKEGRFRKVEFSAVE
jgi:hypothetical protein